MEVPGQALGRACSHDCHLSDNARIEAELEARHFGERAGADIPEAVTASLPVWRTWAELLETWAANQAE